MTDDLEKATLFQGLNPSQLKAISSFCSLLTLLDGDMLIREEDRGDSDIYLLLDGAVEIVSNNTMITSSEVVISKEDKDVFGEIAWLTGSPRTASVRCRGGVNAIRVDGKALTSYLEQHPAAGYSVMREIALTQSRRMQRTDSLLKQILWNSLL